MEKKLFRVSASMSRDGFDELLKKLSSIAGPKGSILIGMESTAFKAAATSIGTASPAKEMIIKQKASILTQLEDHLQELTDMQIGQCQAQMKDNIDILTSIQGIGEKSARNFLVELGGDPGLFPSHRQIIAITGLDPSVYQSGQYVGLSKISKQGNRHLRRIIWLMTVRSSSLKDISDATSRKESKID